MITVFLYGLFMDRQLLSKKGVTAKGSRVAALGGYALQIGERATLVAAADSTVHGLVMSLSPADLDKLYSEAGVADYQAVSVTVTLADATRTDAVCYVLPESQLSPTPNRDYALALLDLARRLGLPAEYLEEIQSVVDASPCDGADPEHDDDAL